MPRVGRVVIPGCPDHVTQRGNNRQDVFFVDDDRREYLRILRQQAKRFGVAVEAYCLMTNHIHLVATPATAEGLARTVGRTHFRYRQYVNRLHGHTGHLWQNRFFSCPLDEEHFWLAVAYVERNPVRARLVRAAWRYPWSSASAHVGGADAQVGLAAAYAYVAGPEATGAHATGPDATGADATGPDATGPDPAGLLDLRSWADRLGPAGDWREALRRPGDEKIVTMLRRCTMTGRPLGSDRFISKFETLLGRRLRALPVGRPKRKRTK